MTTTDPFPEPAEPADGFVVLFAGADGKPIDGWVRDDHAAAEAGYLEERWYALGAEGDGPETWHDLTKDLHGSTRMLLVTATAEIQPTN